MLRRVRPRIPDLVVRAATSLARRVVSLRQGTLQNFVSQRVTLRGTSIPSRGRSKGSTVSWCAAFGARGPEFDPGDIASLFQLLCFLCSFDYNILNTFKTEH